MQATSCRVWLLLEGWRKVSHCVALKGMGYGAVCDSVECGHEDGASYWGKWLITDPRVTVSSSFAFSPPSPSPSSLFSFHLSLLCLLLLLLLPLLSLLFLLILPLHLPPLPEKALRNVGITPTHVHALYMSKQHMVWRGRGSHAWACGRGPCHNMCTVGPTVSRLLYTALIRGRA